MANNLENSSINITQLVSQLASNVYINNDAIIVETTKENLRPLIFILHDNSTLDFKVLTDITCADYPEKLQRFVLIYNILSLTQNIRVIIKVAIEEEQVVNSITDLFAAAGWYEREVFDMYGVIFEHNKDLRRILTDYGFDGHPLKKDFPLTGYVEVRYDLEQRKVLYEPVKLPQEFRKFDFLSPWEGPDYILPGDEKAKS